MGLDTYASRSPGDIELTAEDLGAFAAAGIDLCGGMFSGDDGSFRGKVYVDVVERVAGANLGAEWLSPQEVRKIASAFESCDAAEVAGDPARDRYPATETEILQLRRFFRVCADRGLGLIGWS